MTRRDLSLLLPALAAASSAQAQTAAAKLPSTTLEHESLPVKTNGQNKSRAMLNGLTHTGYDIEMHETELAPGLMPHAAHKHAHEEMILIREGTLEVTIEGKTIRLGPGSVGYVASDEMHGWKNVGDTRASYFVIALGRTQKA
mgnify:CR=1 FL=1